MGKGISHFPRLVLGDTKYFDDLRDHKSSDLTGKPTKQDKNKITSLSKFSEQEVEKKLQKARRNIRNRLSVVNSKNKISNLVEYILTRLS